MYALTEIQSSIIKSVITTLKNKYKRCNASFTVYERVGESVAFIEFGKNEKTKVNEFNFNQLIERKINRLRIDSPYVEIICEELDLIISAGSVCRKP